MDIKNQSYIVVVNDAHLFTVDEICKKLVTPRGALEMISKGEKVPDVFLKMALADIGQVFFLLEGIKQTNCKKDMEDHAKDVSAKERDG